MEKATSFFRVFDLAFFVPGGILLAAVYRSKVLASVDTSAKIDSLPGLLMILTGLCAIYFFGLLCHAIQQTVRRGIKGCCPTCFAKPRPQWFSGLRAETREDMATYFWYMRSTCWNSVPAIVIGAILVQTHAPVVSCGWAIGLTGGAVPALIFLGYEYDGAMRSAAKPVE